MRPIIIRATRSESVMTAFTSESRRMGSRRSTARWLLSSTVEPRASFKHGGIEAWFRGHILQQCLLARIGRHDAADRSARNAWRGLAPVSERRPGKQVLERHARRREIQAFAQR